MTMQKYAKKGENIKVNFYSGYKGEETPRSIVVGSNELFITEILWRKRIREPESGKILEVFCCRVRGNVVKITRSESGECRLTPEGVSLL